MNSYQTVFSIVVAQMSAATGSSIFGDAHMLFVLSTTPNVNPVALTHKSLGTPPGHVSYTQISNVVVAGISEPQS